MAAANKHWKDSLDLLDCPYTQGLSDEEVEDLLLSENEERLEILEWLLRLYQPKLIEILDPAFRKEGRIVKSKSERILKAVNGLSLCRSDDVDLIKGTAPVNKQRLFMKTLIEMVVSKDSGQLINPRDCSVYIDRLCEEGLFIDNDTTINLVPKDLKAEVESLCTKASPPPVIEELRKEYLECSREADALQAQLAELQSKISAPPTASSGSSHQKEVAALNQMLSASIVNLDQLASGFLHSYESHIGTWCQGPEPEANQLGPTAKRVHTQMKKFLPLLEDVKKLRQLRCDLEDNAKENLLRKSVEALSTDSLTSDSIQQCLSIVEESKHRIESGFKSRYPDLLHL